NTAVEKKRLHQRRKPHRQRPCRLAPPRPPPQKEGGGPAGPGPPSPHKPPPSWRGGGGARRAAGGPAACRGWERTPGEGHNERNYAGTFLGARGIRPACIPGVLITPPAEDIENCTVRYT